MIRKILLSILLIFLLPQKIFAAAEFATSYDVLYDVGEDGITTVTEKITLKNLTSEYYANQFKLTIGATQVSDIKAQDPGGALTVTSEQTGSSVTMNVKFNQQVAGLGKSLPWVLSFKSKDFAEKIGRVWEIRAPKIASAANLQFYNLIIAVPQAFGEPSLISPTPKSQSVFQGKTFLTFEADQLKTSGVSAIFGANQLFDFDLSYHLENKNLMPVLTNIALPPDTDFQDIIYQRIEPKPINVTVDDDGNYLAWYRLSRGQKLDIKVYGSAKLYTKTKAQKPYFLADSLRKKYTQADKYWEKDNPQITGRLNEILGDNPPTEVPEKARLIYRFVVDTLKYDSTRLKDNTERLGAAAVLNNPDSAVCMEFTDLFIALARAAGIPSRELNGYAHSANTTLRPLSLNKDVLHSWPEYFDDQKGWVMVDPTWENTTGGVDYFSKLDLNHFVFAVKGSSSLEPVPAGSYHPDTSSNQDSSDVQVSLSNTDFLGHPQIAVQVEPTGPIFAGFPGTIRVEVTNTGNSIYPSVPLSLLTSKLSILNADGRKLGIIPAFGVAQFDFNIRSKSLMDSFEDQIVVMIGGQKFTKDISIRPFVLFQTIPLMVGLVVGLMILIYFAVLGTHIYHKKLKKSKG